jgi:hypothetical protein
MAKTNRMTRAENIFLTTVHMKTLCLQGIPVMLRACVETNKAYIISTQTKDDEKYPPREFESLDAAHVFIRLTEGDP